MFSAPGIYRLAVTVYVPASSVLSVFSDSAEASATTTVWPGSTPNEAVWPPSAKAASVPSSDSASSASDEPSHDQALSFEDGTEVPRSKRQAVSLASPGMALPPARANEPTDTAESSATS